MRTVSCFSKTTFVAGLLLLTLPALVRAQSSGRLDFTAQVAPTGGRPEPVRQLTFYLLSKSLGDVRAEALQMEPPPDLDKFVANLKGSPELKAWMRKHNSVELVGGDFTKNLEPSDIMDIPEFFEAYMSRNSGFKDSGFPSPKYKEKDKTANPDKYNAQRAEYLAAIKKFITAVPESVEGMDADLQDINPYEKWQQLVYSHRDRLERKTIELAQQRYLAARTDTDLEGRGSFSGLKPSTYWISMIDTQALSGDVHLQWDVPVNIRAGETAHVDLTNFNAAKPNTTALNSNN